MIKNYKYRIYPNKEQAGKLLSAIELIRQLYNTALEQKITAYKQGHKSVSCYEQINQLPELKESFPEYKEVHSQTQQDALRRLDKSFKAFFGRIKKGQKAAERGGYALPVSPRNTSQECSNFGEIVEKTLRVRRHKCNNCGFEIDRDENSSRNILRLGIERYRRDYGSSRLGRLFNRTVYEPRSPFPLGHG